jgi:hypothetical protein
MAVAMGQMTCITCQTFRYGFSNASQPKPLRATGPQDNYELHDWRRACFDEMTVHTIARDEFPVYRHVSRCVVTTGDMLTSASQAGHLVVPVAVESTARPLYTATWSAPFFSAMRWQVCAFRRLLHCCIWRVTSCAVTPPCARMPAFCPCCSCPDSLSA